MRTAASTTLRAHIRAFSAWTCCRNTETAALPPLLMEHMIGDARAKGRRGSILTCKDRLIHYYEKFGYKNMGVSASVHGGAVWYDMLFGI